MEYWDLWTKGEALLTDYRAPLAEGSFGAISGSFHGIQGSLDGILDFGQKKGLF